jgi:class 3 adenylate cyclase
VATAAASRRRRPLAAPIWSLAGLSPGQIARRSLVLLCLLMVLVVAAIATRNAMSWIGRPFVGFLVNERLVLGNIGQYHWTGSKAGLRWPDQVVAVNGSPVRSMAELQAAVRAAGVGGAVTYTVDREGSRREVTVRTMRFDAVDVFMTFGLTALSGLGYMLIGVVVFVLKPDTRATSAFVAACFFLSLFAIVSFDIQSSHGGFIRLYLLANAFFPGAWIHLSLVFPQPRRLVLRQPWVQLLPYVVSGLLTVPMDVLYPDPSFLAVYKLVRLYAIVGAAALLIALLAAYFGDASPLERQRARVVLLGASLAFPLPAVAYYLSLFGSELSPVIIQNNFLAVPILIFPAAVAYAIVRHNLFDVDLYIKRAVGYGIMTALVAVAYVSAQFLLGTIALRPGLGDLAEHVYPVLFAFLVVCLFNPINRRVQAAVERAFFRTRSDYKQTVGTVAGALTSMLDLQQIVQQLLYTLTREVAIDAAGVLLLEPARAESRAFLLSHHSGRAAQPVRQLALPGDDPVLAVLRHTKRLITIYDLQEDPRYADGRDVSLAGLQRLGAHLATPLLHRGEVTGAVVLGGKKSGHFYSREDIDLVETMANQAAVAIQNARAHEEVVRYAGELEASLRRIQILESIRTNLAKFVPTTVRQLIEESPDAPSLDKRQADVSVLFADITGYTRLSARMELDDVNRLVERYFGAFLDEILRHGGDVNETAGDGLMVIFQDSDPRRHAEAAVLTARAIQRRAAEINGERDDAFEPITMHVGVNSGVASVGATKIEGLAGTRWTYTASGPTTNIAARLAALAEGASVIISEETYRRLGDPSRFEDLGPQSLKNVAQPLRAYRLVDADTDTTIPDRDALAERDTARGGSTPG